MKTKQASVLERFLKGQADFIRNSNVRPIGEYASMAEFVCRSRRWAMVKPRCELKGATEDVRHIINSVVRTLEDARDMRTADEFHLKAQEWEREGKGAKEILALAMRYVELA